MSTDKSPWLKLALGIFCLIFGGVALIRGLTGNGWEIGAVGIAFILLGVYLLAPWVKKFLPVFGSFVVAVSVSGVAGVFGAGAEEPEKASADDFDCALSIVGVPASGIAAFVTAPSIIGGGLSAFGFVTSVNGVRGACPDSEEEARREAIEKAILYGLIDIDVLKNQYLVNNVVIPEQPLSGMAHYVPSGYAPEPVESEPPLAPNFSSTEQWAPQVPLAPGYNDQQWTPDTSTASPEPESEAVPVSVATPSQDVAQTTPVYYGSGGYDTKTYVKIMWSLRR